MIQTRRIGAGQQGMTLLEMLIVLTIIAVVSAATILTLAPRRGNSTEAAARRLATEVQLAADAAIVSGAPATLTIAANRYRLSDEPWHALSGELRFADETARSLSYDLANGRPFVVGLVSPSDHWRVAFDGARAVASSVAT